MYEILLFVFKLRVLLGFLSILCFLRNNIYSAWVLDIRISTYVRGDGLINHEDLY